MKLFLVVTVWATVVGCSKDENMCSGCLDTAWLTSMEKSIVASGNKGEIYSFRYKGEKVFLIKGCLNCSDYIDTLVNCNGKTICAFGGIAGITTCPDFTDLATEKKLIWNN